MKKSHVFSFLAFLWCVPGVMRADEDLDKEAQMMDAKPQVNETKHSAGLAEQYGVPVERVNDLRSSGKGWGAIRIELGLAEQLAKKDPTTYPTTADALTKVTTMRADGSGYGVIAHNLGMNVGNVMRSVKANKPERPPKLDRPGRPDNVERPNHPDHPMHPDHPKKPGK